MSKYVKVHPRLEGGITPADFSDGTEVWSHMIVDRFQGRLFFGDYGSTPHFDFTYFRLQLQSGEGFRTFTWPQAREFAETILELARQHGGGE